MFTDQVELFHGKHEEIVHAVLYEIVAAGQLVSGFGKFLEHDVAIDTVIPGATVAIDDADFRARAQRGAEIA